MLFHQCICNKVNIRYIFFVILFCIVQRVCSQRVERDSFIICNKKIPLTANCVYEETNKKPKNYSVTYRDGKIFQLIHWFETETKSKKAFAASYENFIKGIVNSHPKDHTKEEFTCLFLGKIVKGVKFHIGASYSYSTYQIILPVSLDNYHIFFSIYSKNNLELNSDIPYPFNQLIQFIK